MFQKILTLMYLAVSIVFLQGCDGGSSNSSNREASLQTGFLVDSAVSGVSYRTTTVEGVTDSDGAFQYRENEVVRFMLGDTLLGEVPGAEQITPFDLAGSEVITGTRNINEALGNDPNPFNTASNFNPFFRVINLAVLLQSLDYDADPENGIEITPEIAELFQGVSINLNQHWETFHEDWSLRRVIAMANMHMLFGSRHGTRQPGLALQHLYETMGISTPVFAVSSKRAGDTELGEGIRIFEYDKDGFLVGSLADYDGDGEAEETTVLQYDLGKPTRFHTIYTDPGLPDQVDIFEYDSLGNLTRFDDEDSSNPGPGPEGIRYFEYDDYSSVTRSEYDIDANGTSDYLDQWEYQYQFNAAGLITRLERDDVPGDGIYEFIVTWEYDADGNMIRETEIDDYDGDGLPDEIKAAEFDASGNQTAWIVDRDGDGSPESIERWGYDERGNGIFESHDQDGDGVPETIEHFHYNEYDHVTLREWDDNADGTVDRSGVQQNEYDERGNRTLLAADYDGDGSVDDTERWEYDTRDNPTIHEYGESVERWFYDDNDNVVRYESEEIDRSPFIAEFEHIETGVGHLFSTYHPSSDIFPVVNQPLVDPADIVEVDGKEWLQPDLFINLSWNDINAVCPEGACDGKLNGHDLTGYTWASVNDLNSLFNHYIGSNVLGPGPDLYEEFDSGWVVAFFADGWRPYGYVHPSLQGWLREPASGDDAYVGTIGIQFGEGFDGPAPPLPDRAETNGADERYHDQEARGAWFHRFP